MDSPQRDSKAYRFEYERRLSDRLRVVTRMQRRADQISNLRVGCAFLAMILGGLVWNDRFPGEVLGIPLVGFAGLVIGHEQTYRARARADRAVQHYRSGLRRIDDLWIGHGYDGLSLAPAEHPYAADLDLFGPASLFELLCTAQTFAGRQTLARWLLAPASIVEARGRQQAVEDLRMRVDLRERLCLAGHGFDSQIQPDRLVRWAEAPPALTSQQTRRWSALAWSTPIAIALGVAAWWGWSPRPVFLLAPVCMAWLVGRLTHRFVQQAQVSAERSARELEALAQVLQCLEHESFESPTLTRLHNTLVTDQGSASQAIERFASILRWAEMARSQLFAPVAFLVRWELHCALRLECWRTRYGSTVTPWLEALGALEALAAVSAYAYEHPDDPFPELIESEGEAPLIEGDGLGHPLLPAAGCVRNPVGLNASTPALIVSGSNMSGKSTYLRTVGLNVVLALAGAPVRAHRLRLSRLRIGATLRVQDSLQHGASRFYAELERLRDVVRMADTGPGVLFLLDELLHGTNSHDRRIGGGAIVEGLLDRGAVGLVTTHDLALAADIDDPRIDLVHFVDEMHQGTLRFDYRLHPGIVQTSNALALMEAIGLPIPRAPAEPMAPTPRA